MVKVLCYGEIEKFKTREEATMHFLECMMCSEGSEKERYSNILCDLMGTNKDFVYDDEDEYNLYLAKGGVC